MFFTIYGRGGYLGHVTWTIYTYFRSTFPRMFHMKFGFKQFHRCMNIVDGRWTDDDGWTPEHGYTISSPFKQKGSGELKRH